VISNAANLLELENSAFDLIAPQRDESVCEWVEKNVELPSGEITGKVRLDTTPYAREILERFTDKKTRDVVMMFPTQSGKTSILILGMLYRIARDPRDTLWVMGNTEQVRAFNKERMMPFVHLCKPVMDLVPKTARGLIDRHWWGFQNQHYASMTLNFVGAGSGTNLKSRPRAVAIMDEVDSYDEELGYDSGVIQLVEERQKTFSFPLSIKASSPTLEGRMIAAEYEKTDKRQFWLPCPRCGEMILLKFKIKSEIHGDCGLRWWHENESEAKTDGAWDFQKVRANAFYKCQCCGGMIHNFERKGMLQLGEWRPQNPQAPRGRHGYHINSLYSVLGPETSLAGIAAKFLLAKGFRSDLKTFINDWLAEPWDESKAYDFQEVKLEAFTSREIPEDSTTPLMAVDVQEGHFWVLVRRFQRPSPEHPHGQSWLLYGDRVDTVEEIVELQKEYKVAGENVTLDMAHRPNQVARIIIEHGWRGVWGSATKKFRWVIDGRVVDRPYSVPQFRDPMLGTSWENRTFKRACYVLFSKDAALDMVSSLRYAQPAIWHCTVNVNPKYASHLNSRVKRQQKNKRTGKVEFVWHELHQQNHLADTESHVTIRALQLGLLSLPNETEVPNVQS